MWSIQSSDAFMEMFFILHSKHMIHMQSCGIMLFFTAYPHPLGSIVLQGSGVQRCDQSRYHGNVAILGCYSKPIYGLSENRIQFVSYQCQCWLIYVNTDKIIFFNSIHGFVLACIFMVLPNLLKTNNKQQNESDVSSITMLCLKPLIAFLFGGKTLMRFLYKCLLKQDFDDCNMMLQMRVSKHNQVGTLIEVMVFDCCTFTAHHSCTTWCLIDKNKPHEISWCNYTFSSHK